MRKDASEVRLIVFHLIYFKFDFFLFLQERTMGGGGMASFIHEEYENSMIQFLAIEKSIAPNISIYWQKNTSRK